MAKKRKPRALPRLTVLAYSRAELVRFSEAAERVAYAADVVDALVNRLGAAVRILEERTATAKKASATRKMSKNGQLPAGGAPGPAQIGAELPGDLDAKQTLCDTGGDHD